NRISLGVQSLENSLLKDIGRIHTAEQFYENYNNIIKVGFNNVNVDLMFSLPNQSLINFEETLIKIVELSPEHISCYSLILEEGTKFYNMYENGLLTPVEDELDREFYYKAINILEKNNYNLYEISNFAKKNKECKHNIVYWQRKEYIGFGLGASSLLNEKRITNTRNFSDYINFKNNKEIEILEKKHMYSEFVFLGLRMIQGISKSKFKNDFGINITDIYQKEINKFLENGLLLEKDDFIYLSKKGIDLSNVVFSEFI
ncbi:MAG: coproporphyrinogen III oxidase, partial [Eubacteriales bacterium]|nr:coproporphyrinogen III oxidase [Eubacteriales bacterium]